MHHSILHFLQMHLSIFPESRVGTLDLDSIDGSFAITKRSLRFCVRLKGMVTLDLQSSLVVEDHSEIA